MKVAKIFTATAVAASVAVICGCGKKDVPAEVDVNSEIPSVAATADENATDESNALADVPQKTLPDETVLVEFNGAKLTYGEAIVLVKRSLTAQGAPAEQLDAIIEQMAPQALPQIAGQFLISEILKAEAMKRNITVTPGDVEEALSNIVERLPQGTTFAEVCEKIGQTEAEIREEIVKGLPVNKLIKEITKDVSVSTNDVAKFYAENPQYFKEPEQVKASHILVSVAADASDADKAAAKAKIENLRKQILDGTNFEAVAVANSDCPSGKKGGDLGFFGHGMMVPEFDEAAFAMNVGDVSDVVETKFGYHIIKLTDRKSAKTTQLAEVAADIKASLENQERSKIVEAYITGLRKDAKYTVHESIKLFEEPENDEVPPEPSAADEAADVK